MTGDAPEHPSKELKDYLFNIILYRQSGDVPPLLAKYPDAVNWPMPGSQTPLMVAVSQDHHEIVKMLLEAGAPVDPRTDFGHTAMYYAGRAPHCIDLLLEHGAKIDAPTDNGETALTNAVDQRHVIGAKMLIERGANIEVKGWNKSTPLLNAAFYGQHLICAALLRAGADMNAVDNQGRNAQQIAEWGRDNNTWNEEYLKTLEVLEPAFAAKSKEELRQVVEKIGDAVEQGTEQPVTVGKALRFRRREFLKMFIPG